MGPDPLPRALRCDITRTRGADPLAGGSSPFRGSRASSPPGRAAGQESSVHEATSQEECLLPEHSQSHKERPAWPQTKTQISPEGNFATSSGSNLPAGGQGSCLRTTPAPFCLPVSLPILGGEAAGASPPERAPHRIWWAGCTGSQARPWRETGPLGSACAFPVTREGRPGTWHPVFPACPSFPRSPNPPGGAQGGVVGGSLWRAVTGLPGVHTCWHLQHNRRSVCKGAPHQHPQPWRQGQGDAISLGPKPHASGLPGHGAQSSGGPD